MRLRTSILAALTLIAVPGLALAFPYPPLTAPTSSELARLVAAQAGLPTDIEGLVAPKAAAVLNDQGIAELARRRQAHAEQAFTHAIALAPQAWLLYNNRAAAYAQRGNFKAALADIETALRLSPDNAMLLARRAAVYEATKRIPQARADLQRALDLSSYNPTFLVQRALLDLRQGELDQARANVDLAVAIDPRRPEVRQAQLTLARYADPKYPCAGTWGLLTTSCGWGNSAYTASGQAFTNFQREAQNAASQFTLAAKAAEAAKESK